MNPWWALINPKELEMCRWLDDNIENTFYSSFETNVMYLSWDFLEISTPSTVVQKQ